MNSKAKSGRGEREFAALCREHGIQDAQRGQQFAGGFDTPDVKGIPGIHAEIKRVERININEAMKQSIKDSEDKAIPIVAHRRNREAWLITMRAADWFALYQEWRNNKNEILGN